MQHITASEITPGEQLELPCLLANLVYRQSVWGRSSSFLVLLDHL